MQPISEKTRLQQKTRHSHFAAMVLTIVASMLMVTWPNNGVGAATSSTISTRSTRLTISTRSTSSTISTRLTSSTSSTSLTSSTSSTISTRLPSSTSSTTIKPQSPDVLISIIPDVIGGAPILRAGANPVFQSGAGQRFIVNVSNISGENLSSQKMVIKVGPVQDSVKSVTDFSGEVGIIDGQTGLWYHLISTLKRSETIAYFVTWTQNCLGKYPFVVRVGDEIATQSFTWSGVSSAAGCPPDETKGPFAPSYFDLPWPADTQVQSTTTLPTPTSSTKDAPKSPTTTTTVVNSTTTTRVKTPMTVVRNKKTLVCKTKKGKRVCSGSSR